IRSEIGGVAIGGRWGRAEVGFMGVAVTFMGDASAGRKGVAVNTCSGSAAAAPGGVAITTHWSHAAAEGAGIAITLDEFADATAGDRGIAIAGFDGFGGKAFVGENGIAIAREGTARGGPGA